MSKRNPQVERLEREVKFLREEIARLRAEPVDIPFRGCGDSGCVSATTTGMATNGGCCCNERELRRAVIWWRRRAARTTSSTGGRCCCPGGRPL